MILYRPRSAHVYFIARQSDMKYTYNEGIAIKGSGRRRWAALSVVGLLICSYVLINSFWPAVPASLLEGDSIASRLTTEQPESGNNRLYIPQLGVDLDLVEETDDQAQYSGQAIHRSPVSGDPVEGGNFVVTAANFRLGLTPDQTRKSSPFYRLDDLNVGDQFYVDYAGKRYAYEIESKTTISQDITDIEARSEDPILTMYSHDLAGSDDDHMAIVARPIGTVAWVNGQPRLKSL